MTILWFLLALGILVTFHEFGHFYVARRCGVKVLRFSVGFGKPLWTWVDKQGTEFCVAAIPLGGYVKMLDEREGNVPKEQLSQAFTQKKPWQKIAIVAAGPLANFILAVLFFWILLLPGGTDVVPFVGEVKSGSLADQAGLETGQEILAVDHHPTPTWRDLNQQLLARLGESGGLSFRVRYPDSDLEYNSTVVIDHWLSDQDNPNPIDALGLTLYQPKIVPTIGRIVPDSPAAQAGLEVGDTLIAADQTELKVWSDLVNYVQDRHNQAILFEVLRGEERLSLKLTPKAITVNGKTRGQIGISPVIPRWPDEMLRPYRYSLPEAFVKATEKTWDTAGFVLLSLKKLILGQISTKSLSGPITIAKVAGDSAKAGWASFVGLLALLSVSLGVFNLLPIPVLDGGHLVYHTVEWIKGRPVSDRIQMMGYQVGLVLVGAIMLLALYNDIMRL